MVDKNQKNLLVDIKSKIKSIVQIQSEINNIISKNDNLKKKFSDLSKKEDTVDKNIYELSELIIKYRNINRKIVSNRIVQIVKDIIFEQGFSNNNCINYCVIKSILSKVIGKINKDSEYLSLTHLFPCNIFSSKEPQEFSIGNYVHFRSMESFTEKYNADDIKNEVIAPANMDIGSLSGGYLNLLYTCIPKLREHPQKVQERFLKQLENKENRLDLNKLGKFLNYGWVIEVEIPECYMDVSSKIALYISDLVLGFLRLFIEGSWLSKKLCSFNESIEPQSGINKLASQ